MMIDRNLLERYYRNQCTEQEVRTVHRWLRDPANAERAAKIFAEMWEKTDEEIPDVPVDFDHMLTGILNEVGEDERITDSRPRGIWRSLNPYQVAAAVTSVLIMSVLVFKLFFQENYFVYATAYGETKVVTLPDGSHVTLNSNSTIRYTYRYDESSGKQVPPREVFLEGEGFFDVKKKENAGTAGVKFVVHANNVDVEVLGTRFNVSTRRGRTMVVLNSGSIRLGIEESGNRTQEMIMTPGELVEVAEDVPIVKKKVDADAYSAWTRNTLIFEDTPVKDVLALIEDNFGYTVVLQDTTLENRLYTDTTPADDLDLLLSKLSTVYHLNVTRSGKTIMLQAKP